MKKIKNIEYDFNCNSSFILVPEFDNVSGEAKDLIERILRPESERITIAEILDHPWLK